MKAKITDGKTETLNFKQLKPFTLYEIVDDDKHNGTIVIMNYLKNCLIALNKEVSWSSNSSPTFKFSEFTGTIELSN